jgi:hypothetical protein
MVSSISSVRVWTQQVALKAFNEAAAERTGGAHSGSPGSLADAFSGSTGDDGEDTALSRLIASLQQQAMTGGATAPVHDDGSVEDISSDAFMKALQQRIDALKASPDTKAMADTMQAALEAGALTITDVVAGEQFVGRDLSPKENPADKTATSERDPSRDIRSVDTSDWSTFLKEHLQRDPYGKYVRNDDSSHKDKVSGASSYFGMIGDTYYYLSWTQPKQAAKVEIQI